jgi:hypothetical protein
MVDTEEPCEHPVQAKPSRLGGIMMPTHTPSSAESLAADVGFDLLGEQFGGNLERAVGSALKAGAVFPGDGCQRRSEMALLQPV